MAGSVTVKKNKIFTGSERSVEYVFSFVADAADGSVPATATSEVVSGFLTNMRTNPGSTAPTANYDITIDDDESVDVLGGEGADRSASVSEQVMPKIGNGYGPRKIDNSLLTLNITNNSVNSATGDVIITIEQ